MNCGWLCKWDCDAAERGRTYREGKSIFINDFECAIGFGLIIYLHEGLDLSHGHVRLFEKVLVPLTYAH